MCKWKLSHKTFCGKGICYLFLNLLRIYALGRTFCFRYVYGDDLIYSKFYLSNKFSLICRNSKTEIMCLILHITKFDLTLKNGIDMKDLFSAGQLLFKGFDLILTTF